MFGGMRCSYCGIVFDNKYKLKEHAEKLETAAKTLCMIFLKIYFIKTPS